jgi:hypothetical protein
MKKQGNVTLLEIHNSLITESKDTEKLKCQRIQKSTFKNDQ